MKGRIEKAAGETAGKIKDGVERGVDAVKDAVTGRPRDKRPPR